MDFKNIFNKLFTWEVPNNYQFELPEKTDDTESTVKNTTNNVEKNIFSSIDVNLEYLKTRYNFLINSDIVIREFNLLVQNRQYKAFLLFIDGGLSSCITTHEFECKRRFILIIPVGGINLIWSI